MKLKIKSKPKYTLLLAKGCIKTNAWTCIAPAAGIFIALNLM